MTQFLERLADALAARIGGSAPVVRAGPAASSASAAPKAAPAGRRGRRKGAKRSPALLERTTSELYAYIKANSGKRIEEISAAIGVGTKDLALPAKKLLADGKIKTKGQKRATKYFA